MCVCVCVCVCVRAPACLNKETVFRTLLKDTSTPDIQIVQPINVQVVITRNLAASWYGRLPAVQLQGVLQSLRVCADLHQVVDLQHKCIKRG